MEVLMSLQRPEKGNKLMIFINHENELTWNNKYQILYFYAIWMPFNQKVIHMLEKLTDITVFAINIDYFKSLCKRFDINTIPTILIIEDGKERKRVEGIIPSQEFVAIFDDICTT